MIQKVNKVRNKQLKRALSYLQGAVGHVNVRYLVPVPMVYHVQTDAEMRVGEMEIKTGTYMYPVCTVTATGHTLWVGFALTDQPGDVYKYYACARRADGTVDTGWNPHLADGFIDQALFTKRLKQVLDSCTCATAGL